MRTITVLICILSCLSMQAQNIDEHNQIPQKDISIRLNLGIASANLEGTGESLWYSNPKESSRGFQYGIDLLKYHKYIGYGFAFKHYMHGLSFPENAQNSSLHENVQIFYLAPQFSSINEAKLLKGNNQQPRFRNWICALFKQRYNKQNSKLLSSTIWAWHECQYRCGIQIPYTFWRENLHIGRILYFQTPRPKNRNSQQDV